MIIKLIIADTQKLTLFALNSFLNNEPTISVVALCNSTDELMVAMSTYTPNILVIHINFLGQDYASSLLKLQKTAVKVVLLTTDEADLHLFDIIQFGVAGIIDTNMALEQLIPCLYKVHSGKYWQDITPTIKTSPVKNSLFLNNLSPHEIKIAHLVSNGLSNKEIARKINSTEGAVKTFLHRIYGKLEIKGRVKLALLMNESELL